MKQLATSPSRWSSEKASAPVVLYLAHDLNDPAICRRVVQLKRGGAEVRLVGFRRGAYASPLPVDPVELGSTHDARFGHRILSVLRAVLLTRRWSDDVRRADVLLARSLEMAVLGMVVKLRVRSSIPLAYECLDIHRLLVDGGRAGSVLRLLERAVLRASSTLITSSPAFVREYFRPRYGDLPRTMLWENQILSGEQAVGTIKPKAEPWRIGWFGVIRCRRSLAILQDLCLALPGKVEVYIRGRPTQEISSKLGRIAAATPGIVFEGPYDRSKDLGEIYGQVHFTWAIDYFEEGANSRWLLPNRLYEGAAHSAIPIALKSVETGRWLHERGAGILLSDEEVTAELTKVFLEMTDEAYDHELMLLRSIPSSAFLQDDDELRTIVHELASAGASKITL